MSEMYEWNVCEVEYDIEQELLEGLHLFYFMVLWSWTKLVQTKQII